MGGKSMMSKMGGCLLMLALALDSAGAMDVRSQLIAADMIAGTLGHCVGFSSVYPMNKLTRIQGPDETPPAQKEGPLKAFRREVMEQGLLSTVSKLFRGIGKDLALQAVIKASTIWSFTEFGSAVSGMSFGMGLMGQVLGVGLAAAGTGILAGAIMHPWQTMMTTKSVEGRMTPLKVMKQSFEDKAMNAEMELTFARETVGFSFFLTSHTVLCWMFPAAVMTVAGNALAGATAGVICTFAIFPFLKIKNAIMRAVYDFGGELENFQSEMAKSRKSASALWDTMKDVVRRKGFWGGLFEGVGILMPQAIVHNVCGFTVYFLTVPTVRKVLASWMPLLGL